ncbi:MAG: fumarylacetoacetate hydrolase family protein [Bacteroidales bacterium]
MKIICIGHNYLSHIKELGQAIPQKPVFFCKPDSALLLKDRPLYLPDFSNEIYYETELVVKICRLGKSIQTAFAHTYYEEIGLGFDFTARDLLQGCVREGLPWEIAKSFDNSACLGQFIPKSQLSLPNLEFTLEKNGEIVQVGHASDMVFNIDQIISYVSQFMTLKIGDCIFTGTPSGVGKLQIGDQLEAKLNGKKLLSCAIK